MNSTKVDGNANGSKRRRARRIIGAATGAAVVALCVWPGHARRPAEAPHVLAAAREEAPPPRAEGNATKPSLRDRASAIASAAPAAKAPDTDWVVVPPDPESATARVVWTQEREGVTATLDENGTVAFVRDNLPGETPSVEKAPPPAVMAAIAALNEEARAYAKANLVTMPRKDYEAMAAADEDERAFDAAQRKAEIERGLAAEKVPADKRGASWSSPVGELAQASQN